MQCILYASTEMGMQPVAMKLQNRTGHLMSKPILGGKKTKN